MNEVGIVIDISRRLIEHLKLSTENALYIIDHVKENFEELQKAERDGGLLEFYRKLKEGRKQNEGSDLI
ncbi:hypothetical protein [Paenibacillus sp. DMB20]|uniref:hypothetical protein n=1 Tax=Paenibacillus sp. DMB20 TaxID=1642570 RepID=UPI0006278E7F|nr:hypothetical protein [Paenibacillus sp. DMB20]KKO51160.1 hypothetical protein XI25_29685 [Paenibacillus sp. DMB20]